MGPAVHSAAGLGRARTHFHVALACVLLPVVSLPLVLGAALRAVIAARRGAEVVGWARRLAALAAVDLLLGVTLVTGYLAADAQTRSEATAPAARAEQTQAPSLFTPTRASDRCFELEAVLPSAGAWLLAGFAFALCLALWMRGRRRGVSGASFWVGFAGVVGLSVASGPAATWLGCVILGGHTLGAGLAALLGQGLVMVAGGWLLARRVGNLERPTVLLPPRLEPGAAYGLGVYYAACWLGRIAVFGLGLSLLLSAVTPVARVLALDMGPAGTAMLFVGAALLAPLGEELLFRGALLPRLCQHERPWVAIVLSSLTFGAMHVQHGAAVLGPLVLGLVFGWARARTGSLVPSVLLHVSFNTATLVLSRAL
jgi:membrane protease YdiL (CAAX protease family)